MSLFMQTGATFSDCRNWRYSLWRIWNKTKPHVLFIMLNPSTADERADDSTITRCIGYAKEWGYGGLMVCNIFSIRSTDPKGIREVADPIGPGNDEVILKAAANAKEVVCGWGNPGLYLGRSKYVLNMLRQHNIIPKYLKLNANGTPRHPLYLKKSLTAKEFDGNLGKKLIKEKSIMIV